VTETAGLPATWGVRPVLFHLGPLAIPSYEVLVLLGLLAGFALLWWDGRRQPRDGRLMSIVVAALVGAALGARLLEWAFNPLVTLAHLADGAALIAGRTVIGGFLGGAVAVWLVKRRLGVVGRRGNLLAAPIALGLCIGRVGCFLRGCCFGTETALPWGVDFGDGVARHPTQLYEAAFALVALVTLRALAGRVTTPGRLFSGFMVAYFGFRFAEEVVRAGPHPLFGLSFYQMACVVGVALFLGRELRPRVPTIREAGNVAEVTHGT
jgi:phosphatidylglycerol---prolipoprotein diacylglyceryl transferase